MSWAQAVGRRASLLALAGILAAVPAETKSAPQPAPRLEPVAETRLIMEGMLMPNYRGLERILKQAPADNDGWVFARGQALLIAEGGNLLLLRPPHNAGAAVWQDRAAELRATAAKLARAAAERDYARCRLGLHEVAGVCNRCHHAFRVPTRFSPFAAPAPAPAHPPPPARRAGGGAWATRGRRAPTQPGPPYWPLSPAGASQPLRGPIVWRRGDVVRRRLWKSASTASRVASAPGVLGS